MTPETNLSGWAIAKSICTIARSIEMAAVMAGTEEYREIGPEIFTKAAKLEKRSIVNGAKVLLMGG